VLVSPANVEPPVVFPVALYGGKNKQSNLEFLEETIQDLNQLLIGGFSFSGRQYACETISK